MTTMLATVSMAGSDGRSKRDLCCLARIPQCTGHAGQTRRALLLLLVLTDAGICFPGKDADVIRASLQQRSVRCARARMHQGTR
jgi:hypothetical protein